MSNNLKVGFSRVNITPSMGIELGGYYKLRLADGVLDDIEVNVIALSDKRRIVLMVTIDHCGIFREVMDSYKGAISEKTGVPIDAIYIHATHTHTAPRIQPDSITSDPLIINYREYVKSKAVDACVFAIEDLKPAKMGFGMAKAENVAFIRRYRMKDGSVKTNPGVNNPDIVEPIGEIDDRVCVLRFAREGADDIVLANFANHPDTVGGNKISGDWPTLFRHTIEKAIDNVKAIFFNGAQGDVNHVNVHPKGGDFNDMFHDFDGCSRGYGHARHVGRVVAGAVLQIYDKVEYVDVEEIDYLQKEYEIAYNKATPEELVLAHKYNDLHLAGRDDEIPFTEMMLTTVVAEAGRMVKLENAPDYCQLLFSAIRIGDVALFGIPGEPFNVVGREIKKAQGYKMIIPTCLTNGSEGYYPSMDAYVEGGYEARSSKFKAGVAERMIEIGKEMLGELK